MLPSCDCWGHHNNPSNSHDRLLAQACAPKSIHVFWPEQLQLHISPIGGAPAGPVSWPWRPMAAYYHREGGGAQGRRQLLPTLTP